MVPSIYLLDQESVHALGALFWICEYIITGPLAGPLSVGFSDVKFIYSLCILNFEP